LGRNMRVVALLATARLQPRPKPIDLCEMAEQVAKEMLPEALAARLRMEVDLPAEETYGRVDRDHLYSVMRTLLQNACAYTPPGGVVRIRVARCIGRGSGGRDTEEEVELTVSDTGVGVPPEEQGQIFDAFFRGEGEFVRSRPGNGLGLAVAKGLVELQGGAIRCESRPGQGSTFTVTLPLAEPDEACGSSRPTLRP